MGDLQTNEELVNCYNAADYFIIPSLQDNHPKTIMEALSCGIPSIGFNTGGIPEMIEHNKTGFIAEKGDCHDLANQLNIAVNLEDERLDRMKNAARKEVLRKYTYDKIADQHIRLYDHYLNPSL
jgi:glycosyltransferase involved in cell wall biosynthesis